MIEQTNFRYKLKSTAVPGHTVSVEGGELALYIEQSGQKLTGNYNVKLRSYVKGGVWLGRNR